MDSVRRLDESLNNYLTPASHPRNMPAIDLGQMVPMIETRLQASIGEVLRQETVQSMVHDMRAPMTVLKGYLNILLSGMVGDMKEEQRRLVQQSVGPLEELILLTDNLLQAASLEERSIALTRIGTDLDLLLADVVEFYRLPFEQRKMTLSRDTDARGLTLTIDPFWIKRVLHNLVWNAYKFTPDGGDVVLRVSGTGAIVEIAVEDSGRGVPADKRPILFDKFSQCATKDRKFGAGLGLWICRQIMELHGGAIRVENPARGGSRFVLSFPA